MKDFFVHALSQHQISCPFGVSDAGMMTSTLENLFKTNALNDIESWLDTYSDRLDVLDLETTPVLPLYLCAAYAVINNHDAAQMYFDMCLNNPAIWRGFAGGDLKHQRVARQWATRHIDTHLSLNPKQHIDLLMAGIHAGDNSFLLDDVRDCTKKNRIHHYAISALEGATHDDPFIKQTIQKIQDHGNNQMPRRKGTKPCAFDFLDIARELGFSSVDDDKKDIRAFRRNPPAFLRPKNQ